MSFFCCQILQVLVYFLCKNCNLPKKSNPLLSQQPPPKNWDPAKPSPFFVENLAGSSTTAHSRKGGGCVHYGGKFYSLNLFLKFLTVFCDFLLHSLPSENSQGQDNIFVISKNIFTLYHAGMWSWWSFVLSISCSIQNVSEKALRFKF